MKLKSADGWPDDFSANAIVASSKVVTQCSAIFGDKLMPDAEKVRGGKICRTAAFGFRLRSRMHSYFVIFNWLVFFYVVG